MVRIRLSRKGAKKRPFYRIVVADARCKRDGRFIEQLGHYDPLPEEVTVKIDEERARYWLSQGAQPSSTVANMFRRAGLMEPLSRPS